MKPTSTAGCLLLVALSAVAGCATAFSYSNCGSTSDPLQIISLTVGPNPLILGQNISVSFKASLTGANLTSGGRAEVKIWKHEGVWIEVPCLDNAGSCTYNDLCSLIPDKPCGPILTQYHLPCKCPFVEGAYGIPNVVSIPTKNPGLSWLTDGQLSAQATLYNEAGTRLACVLVYVTLAEGEMRIGESTKELADHPSLQQNLR